MKKYWIMNTLFPWKFEAHMKLMKEKTFRSWHVWNFILKVSESLEHKFMNNEYGYDSGRQIFREKILVLILVYTNSAYNDPKLFSDAFYKWM